MAEKINRAAELLSQGQAVYYDGPHSGHVLTFEQGKADAVGHARHDDQSRDVDQPAGADRRPAQVPGRLQIRQHLFHGRHSSAATVARHWRCRAAIYSAATAKRRSGSAWDRSIAAPASNFWSSGITVLANIRRLRAASSCGMPA